MRTSKLDTSNNLRAKSATKAGVLAMAAMVGVSSFLAHTPVAWAADTGEVSPKGKGIVGGALLGIEVVDITMGAIGVNRGWPYFVFGGLGGVGGAIGGFFVEKASTDSGHAEPALYMLAGGMALVVPALVISLNATAYKPPESDTKEPVNATPPVNTTAKVYKRPRVAARPAFRHIPLSAVDIYNGRLALALPAVSAKPLYTEREIAQFGVAQGHEIRFPILSAAF